MDLIDRYIYAVTSLLPKSQREQVEREIRIRIEDMLSKSSTGLEYSKADIERVLKELGEPSHLANQYRGEKRYLIGPEFFETYLKILRIVVTVAVFGVTIGKSIELFGNPAPNVVQGLGELIGSVFSGAMQGFAWVTFIFALNDHYKIFKNMKQGKDEWRLSNLPQTPKKVARIRRSEPIFGILFAVLFTMLFVFKSSVIGVYHFENEQLISIIPIFSPEGIKNYFSLIIMLFSLSILKEFAKFIVGKWTLSLGIINALINFLSLGICTILFSAPGLWNGNFVNELYAAGMVPTDLAESLKTNWGIFTRGFIYFIALGFIMDSMVSLYKGMKYKWL